jgi:hypothetical protein
VIARTVLYTILLILLLLGCFLVMPSLYWRDSGELILSALYLDIAHPPGFPLYGMLSNLVTQLPFGPIAWRVNLFSWICSLASLALAVLLLIELTKAIASKPVPLITLLPIVAIATSQAFYRQSISAEVYSLNTALTLAILYLFFKWLAYSKSERDNRLLISAAFLAGLALGNHVSIVLFIAPSLMIAIFARQLSLNLFLRSVVFGLVGLSIYAYLPLRALNHPALNTGDPSTLKRFIYQISNQRDRDLRVDLDHQLSITSSAENSLSIYSESASFSVSKLALSEYKRSSALADDAKKTYTQRHKSTNLQQNLLSLGIYEVSVNTLSNIYDSTRKDAKKLLSELSASTVLAAAIGFGILALRVPIHAALLGSAALANSAFFSGWDADPWLTTFIVLVICYSLLAHELSSLFRISRALQNITVLTFFACACLGLNTNKIAERYRTSNFELPRERISSKLSLFDAGATVLIDSSWFAAKYLRDVENYRPDLNLVYVQSLLYPEYFGALELTNQSRYPTVLFSSALQGKEQLLTLASKATSIGFEPSTALNHFINKVIRCDEKAIFYLQKGTPGSISSECIESKIKRANTELASINNLAKIVQYDSKNALEHDIVALSDLLASAELYNEAIKLLHTICASPEDTKFLADCNSVLLNNLTVYYLRVKNFELAEKVARFAIRNKRGKLNALQHNLTLALEGLKQQKNSLIGPTRP